MAEGCRRCYVSGRVQGVGFRFSTHQQGRALGLAVSARNLPDGRVEVIARGCEDALDALCEWLRCGPAHARVVDVRCESLPRGGWPEFGAD
jgi:acylphosphatase